jgi:hypothetical protein
MEMGQVCTYMDLINLDFWYTMCRDNAMDKITIGFFHVLGVVLLNKNYDQGHSLV